MDGISDQYSFIHDRLKLGFRPFLLKITYALPRLGVSSCDSILGDPNVLQFLNANTFDLIVIDVLFNECAFGIAYKMKAKTVIFGTTHPMGWLPDALGYPAETWWLPEVHFSFDLPLTFVNRVWATLSTFYFNIIRFRAFPELEKILRERLQIPNMPSIPDMMANTSLVLTNTHFSEELARSFPPNVVPIGGMNCVDASKLNPIPKNMLEFIEGAGDDGFILVSFGSGAKISDAPENVQSKFFRAFENLRMRIIWKWETDRPKEMPKNVMTVKWIPQQELLSHPKLKVFITHGGLLSMHEAICHPVPMIAFPVFAEQDFNAERLHRTGRGIRLEISTFTQQQLEDAVQKILSDDSFKTNVVTASKRFFDRPQKPVDAAVWWIEYVLRHEDTSFMRPLAVNQTWYQRRLLDVWGFLFVLLVILTLTICKIVRYVVGLIRRKLFCSLDGSRKNAKVKKA